jgi:hypothetical protein
MARKLRGVAAAFAVCLIAPQGASAVASITRDGTTIVFTEDAASPSAQDIDLAKEGADYLISDNNVVIANNASGCVSEPGHAGYYRCSNVTAFRLDLGAGNDQVRLKGGVPTSVRVDVPLTIDGGEGIEDIHAGTANDVIRGGPGPDELYGYGGDDLIEPGTGLDRMAGGIPGADAGTDTVSYAERTEPVQVELGDVETSFNGSANDELAAAPGVRDVLQGFERAIGGSGDDELFATGSYAVTLEGRGGVDEITGAAEGDSLYGGDGGDLITGAEGDDLLDGGDGGDTFRPNDGEDDVLGGAGFDFVDALDGFADDVDCGPDYGAASADAIDAVASCNPPPPGPPAPTVITNTVTLPSRVLFDLSYTFTATRRGTVLRNLAADLEPGARVSAACRTKKNRRCTRTKDLARGAASVRLKGFEGKRLPVGAKLTIRVTKEGMIGVVKTLTIRRRKPPSLKTAVLPAA